MQSLASGVSMFLTLPSSPLSFAWTWIASLNIIDAFHFGLPCPSYSVFFCVEIQRVLHIPLVWLVVDPFV
jgi:hypothetical protein